MRWGSIAAETFLRARIVAAPLPPGVKVYPGSLLPQAAALPAIHFWREAATDADGPIGVEIARETLRYVVTAVGAGHDVEALVAVANPMHDAIHGVDGRQDGLSIQILRAGELPLDPRVYDQDEPLVRLGGVYAVEVME